MCLDRCKQFRLTGAPRYYLGDKKCQYCNVIFESLDTYKCPCCGKQLKAGSKKKRKQYKEEYKEAILKSRARKQQKPDNNKILLKISKKQQKQQ